jgi:N-acetylglucosaminyl-diphospho-decaprenol L-rhamnosyltransferase
MLTLNLPEALPFNAGDFSFPVIVQVNPLPKGFSANHNQAFRKLSGQIFCVMNPDIRLNNDPFPALIACLQDSSIGVSAPLVVNEYGAAEDSARRFPTPFKILCKAIGKCKGSDYIVKDEVVFPDWVGGMFMLFHHAIFAQLGGFDQCYFLYYEDVNLCARLRLKGYKVALCPDAKVVHLARRDSRRHLKYLKWHLTSMARYFFSRVFLKILWLRLTAKSS